MKTKTYEGVAEMLNEFAARGLKMAILSNKPDGFTKRSVSELLPNWTFDIVLGERKGVPLKPHPAGALEVA
ncbi:HAD hydrolase-like protein, partial [Candidatus Saccharibacteria bacterium]|nr:HAD hydrolase-like protein [candidate division Zixibacteria bacterium]NIT04120.1 HAD hydrolase-like protein [Candidatus Saccharibacteria bacterium]